MGLIERAEVGGVVEVVLVALFGRRAVDLAAAVEGLPAQSGVSGHLGGEVYGQTVGPCLLAVGFQRACVILRLQVVGQVDHKAGIAASGALGDPLAFEQHDPVFRAQLAQAPGGGETREASTDHQPVSAGVLRKLDRRVGGWQQGVPRCRSGVSGQGRDGDPSPRLFGWPLKDHGRLSFAVRPPSRVSTCPVIKLA